jgi:hypothetical protein
VAEDSAQNQRIGHTGKRVRVKWLGGESHGQEGMLPRPIRKEVVTAAPPRYLGNNFYEANPAALMYETYFLKDNFGTLYYVHEDWVAGFPGNIDQAYEPTNARLLREEKERGGPIDLVEGEDAPEDIKKFMNQNVVGRCDRCLRATFKESDLEKECKAIKSGGKKCHGHFVAIKPTAKATVQEIDPIEESLRHTEDEQAQLDFKLYGIAFLVDGKRVDPKRVKMMVRTKNPLTISLKDILDA